MGETKKQLKRHILRLQHDVDALSKTVLIISEDIKNHQCHCENYKPKTVTFKRFMEMPHITPLKEGDKHPDKTPLKEKSYSSSALEAVVYCRDCIHKEHCGWKNFNVLNWFCADGEKEESHERETGGEKSGETYSGT